MAQNLKIDPRTGDYVIMDGRPVGDDTLDTPAYIREKASRNQWLYAPDSQWGSDFYLFDKRHLPQDDKAITSAAVRAAQPLIDSGRAVSAVATLDSSQRNQMQLTLKIVAAAGEPTTLTFDPIRN